MLSLSTYKSISVTHKSASISEVGNYVLENEQIKDKLIEVKDQLQISEILYLGTCNRVEFIFTCDKPLSGSFLKDFCAVIYGEKESVEEQFITLEGEASIVHFLSVASSIDSVVVGEREILTQIRKAFNFCSENLLCGDFIKILVEQAILVSKRIYTETNISSNKVSAASIACDILRKNLKKYDPTILLIGAGDTIQLISKYLVHHEFSNIYVFNRTIEKAKDIANQLNGQAFELNDLKSFTKGFDIIITCTGAQQPIITNSIYEKLVGEDKEEKIIMDLAVPRDTAVEVIKNQNIEFIDIELVNSVLKNNIDGRLAEIKSAKELIKASLTDVELKYKERQIEKVLSLFPQNVKELSTYIKERKFAQDIDMLDDESKEVIYKIIAYMEKKYIKYPMINAKNIFV